LHRNEKAAGWCDPGGFFLRSFGGESAGERMNLRLGVVPKGAGRFAFGLKALKADIAQLAVAQAA